MAGESCPEGILKDIVSTCETAPTGGMEVEAYIINRKDILSWTVDATNKSKISGLILKTGKQAYKLTGTNKSNDAGGDRVIADKMPDTYTQYFAMTGFEWDAASVENFDNLKDLVIIYQRKDQLVNTDGVFQMGGFRAGLYVTTDTFRINTDNSVRAMELASKEGQTEPYMVWTYDEGDVPTTKAALEALLTPAA